MKYTLINNGEALEANADASLIPLKIYGVVFWDLVDILK